MPASLSMTIAKVKAMPKTMRNYENRKHSPLGVKFYDEYNHDKDKEKVMVSAGMITIKRRVHLDDIYSL